MKIIISQLNPTVGDIPGNLTKIKEILDINKENKPDLVILPELYLVGYPPKDLLERDWFIEKVESALTSLCEISKDFPETGLLVGTPQKTNKNSGKRLYNSSVLIYRGKIIFKQHKSLLPTYDVFDEERYFDTPEDVDIVSFKGEKLGISICEDAWNEEEVWPSGLMYQKDPIEILAKKGATLLINISASPFHLQKEEVRYNLIKAHAKRHNLPFIYVNQVGANDELIFDGGSMVFDKNGDLIYMSPFFNEDTFLIDLGLKKHPLTFTAPDELESLSDALVLGIKDYVKKCGFSKVVIGLSGGIDSALTCALAVKALGKENVLGITMPSQYSSSGSVTDSQLLASNLNINIKEIPIKYIFESYLKGLENHFKGLSPNVAEENIQARIRGNLLMAFSNKFGYLVLSTGNKSELAVGYCTLYGDMCGGLCVLADVPKTMVYDLSRHFNEETELIPVNTIKKAPSAELRPDQTDQDTLPSYDVLDEILNLYIEEKHSIDEIVSKGFEKETVEWVVKTVDKNEYKRKQAALGLKITTKAFGYGRRMPIAAIHPHTQKK